MENIDRRVFDTAFRLWTDRAKQLADRERLKRYTYGDQWGDVVTMTDGERIVEGDWIRRTGRRPITNNLIRRLVRTIVGRYRDLSIVNDWYDDDPESVDASLSLEEIDSRLLEEFLISGMAVQRVADDGCLNREGVNVCNVSPDRFFCNEFRDPRGDDIECIGMLHDLSPAEVLIRFGKNFRDNDTNTLRKIVEESPLELPFTRNAAAFYTSLPGRVRVVEVWSREYASGGTLSWRARWYTAAGRLLDTYVSPWKHRSHPFVIKFYPLVDGEVHSFVEDVIDQQRYINRIIVLIDRILATSAKGVLLFPAHQRPQDLSWEEIGRRWASPDGVIPLRGNDDIFPHQISGSSGDAAAYRLLEMELKLFDQTAGVGSVLMATDSNGASGAQHYQARVENATAALADIFRTFRSLVTERNRKLLNVTNS